jgi:hypothetical protein
MNGADIGAQAEQQRPPELQQDLQNRPPSEPDHAAERPGVMIPTRGQRLPFEAPLMRAVATAGIVAIGVVIAAIMTSQHSQGWIIGVVVSIVSVALAAVLWSSRRL